MTEGESLCSCMRAQAKSKDESEMRAELTPKAQADIEESFRNDKEAHNLLAVINAEFISDPMSVQCFDLRIVERVKRCVETREELAHRHPLIM